MTDRDMEQLALTEPEVSPAPSRLKAKIYSRLLAEQGKTGRLRELAETEAAGRGLCIWEQLVQITPGGRVIGHWNFCAVCHARHLAELLENPPLRWRNCPYSHFGDA